MVSVKRDCFWACNYYNNILTADEYKDITAAKVTESKKLVGPTIASINPLDKMNMHSEEFLSGVRGLAAKLNVGEHHNHLIVLEAVARVIYGKLRPEALLQSLPQGTAFPIKEGDKCAFDDKDVDQAAKILRLLQIQVSLPSTLKWRALNCN